MKKLMLFLVVAAAGWVGYQYMQTGSIPFLSSSSSTPEERELDVLFDRFEAARAQFRRAGKSSGLTGMDNTAEVEAAVQEVKRVEKAFARLKSKLVSEAAKKKAGSLDQAIRLFKSKL